MMDDLIIEPTDKFRRLAALYMDMLEQAREHVDRKAIFDAALDIVMKNEGQDD